MATAMGMGQNTNANPERGDRDFMVFFHVQRMSPLLGNAVKSFGVEKSGIPLLVTL